MTAHAQLAAPDELALAKRCAARDPAALRELMGANNQRMFRAAWSVLKDRYEAEEAVQSAYLKAFNAIGDFADGQVGQNYQAMSHAQAQLLQASQGGDTDGTAA